LEDIRDRIASENPQAAHRVVSRIRATVERLSVTPGMAGRVEWLEPESL
jgi:plasmid stabilization system protein ParE